GAVDARAEAQEHRALPSERRPYELTVAAFADGHARQWVDQLEDLDVGRSVETFALTALAPQGPHARGRPRPDDGGASVHELGEPATSLLVEAAAGHQHRAQVLEGPFEGTGRLEQAHQV